MELSIDETVQQADDENLDESRMCSDEAQSTVSKSPIVDPLLVTLRRQQPAYWLPMNQFEVFVLNFVALWYC